MGGGGCRFLLDDVFETEGEVTGEALAPATQILSEGVWGQRGAGSLGTCSVPCCKSVDIDKWRTQVFSVMVCMSG